MSWRTNLACALAAVTILAPSNAQSTLVVSETGGGQFTEIQPAVDAAQPGDLIRVLAGYYNGFVVDKGVRIVGEPGVYFFLGGSTGIVVHNLPAGQRLVIREVSPSLTFSGASLQIRDCLGHVHIENLNPFNQTVIERSRQVSVHGSRLNGNPAAVVRDSTVLFTQSTILASGTLSLVPGLECERSNVTIAQSWVRGGTAPHGFGAGGPGLRIVSGVVTLGGDQTRVDAGFGFAPGGAPAIEAVGGTVRVDPAVQLVPSPGQPIALGPGRVVTEAVPSLSADVTPGKLTVRLHAAGAQAAYLLVGFPLEPPVVLPFGELWISPFHALLDAGAVPSSGVRTTVVSFPPLPVGAHLVFQSLVTQPTGLQLSTAVVRTLDF